MIIPLENHDKFELAVLDIIRSAQKDDMLLLNYFVIRNDHCGNKLLLQIYQAAQRGVQVSLILDSYGSLHQPADGTEYDGPPLCSALLSCLKQVGIKISIYHHIRKTSKFYWHNVANWKTFSRRNHNKNFLFSLKQTSYKRAIKGLIIGDGQWADEHFGQAFRGRNYYVESNSIYEACLEYSKKLLSSDCISEFAPPAAITGTYLHDFYHQQLSHKLAPTQNNCFTLSAWYRSQQFHAEELSFVYSDIEFQQPKIRQTIQHFEIELLNRASLKAIYTTPYFAPDQDLSQSFINLHKKLSQAFKILIGHSYGSPYMPYGTQIAARRLLKKGINLFEYLGPGNFHYKEIIVDDYCFIKTANGEGRSRFYNLDTGVIIKSRGLSQFVQQLIEKDLKHSIPISPRHQFVKETRTHLKLFKTLACPLYYHHL